MSSEIKRKMSNEELKHMIVDLKVSLVRANIPRGHCPYAYYSIEKTRDNCDECVACSKEFYAKMREKIELEVSEY